MIKVEKFCVQFLEVCILGGGGSNRKTLQFGIPHNSQWKEVIWVKKKSIYNCGRENIP